MSTRATPILLCQRMIPKSWLLPPAQGVVMRLDRRRYSGYSISARDSIEKPLHSTSSGTRSTFQQKPSTGLERLPTSSLLRNYFMGAIFTSPILFRLAFRILERVATSRSALLNPDLNPLLRAVIKPLVYDQFCAGTNQSEIFRTRDAIKKTGFAGVILCYGKEYQISQSNELQSTGKENAGQMSEINWWLNGNLETLDMLGEGDWLGMKLSGAGAEVTTALMQNQPPPAEFVSAMDAICAKARTRNCRIWVDAEQQVLQTAIDTWTIDLMRKHNSPAACGPNGQALLYNTIQAYLKASRTKLRQQLALADREGWTLAVKLVRGAYIANDQREKIHDSKPETDASYDGIVADLLAGTNLGFRAEDFPRMQLFLAGHNPHSVNRAWELVQELSEKGELKVVPDFGQLQGMADGLSCRFLQRCEEVRGREGEEEKAGSGVVVPKIYKCLTWGTVQECMQYLLRRIIENQGGAERMRDGMKEYGAELRRRMFGLRA